MGVMEEEEEQEEQQVCKEAGMLVEIFWHLEGVLRCVHFWSLLSPVRRFGRCRGE